MLTQHTATLRNKDGTVLIAAGRVVGDTWKVNLDKKGNTTPATTTPHPIQARAAITWMWPGGIRWRGEQGEDTGRTV